MPRDFATVDYETLTGNDAGSACMTVLEGDIRFLPEYHPGFSERFTDWLDEKRDHVHRKLVNQLLALAKEQRIRHDWQKVDAIVSTCLQLQPFNDEAVYLKAETMAIHGDKKGSLKLLKDHARKLGAQARSVPSHALMARIAERIPENPYTAMRRAPLVGRKDSVRQLHAFVDRGIRSNGGTFFLWGDAGIGKSRLVEEGERYAVVAGATVTSVKCQPGDAQTPLSVFMNLVPRLQELPGAAGCNDEVKRNLSRITSYDPEVERVQDPDAAEILKAQIRMSVMDLVDAVTDEQPIVLVVEDIHWIDQHSAKLLQDIGSWSSNRQMGIILTSRKDYKESTSLPVTSAITQCQLTRLDEDETKELAHEIISSLGSRGLDGSYLEQIVSVSEGNPFFLHELIKHWIDTGERHVVPPSVQVILQERLALLTSGALRTLQVVAMLGKHCTLERMSYVLDYKPYEMLDVFEELGVAGMLVVEGKEVRSRHDLLSTEAISKFALAAKKLLHRRIAGVLEREIEGRPSTSLLWDCAEHYKESGDINKARWLTLSCARHLTELGYQRDAVDIYKQSLAYCTNDMDRLKVIPELAKAQAACALWTECANTTKQAQSLMSQENYNTNHHNSLEILELHSIWRAYRTNDHELLQRIIQCIRDDNSTETHKIEAACLGMKIGAILGDIDTMKCIHTDIYHVLADEPQDTIAKLTTKLIYECTCGDKNQAIKVANTLIEVAKTTDDQAKRLNAFSHCALAFRRYGDVNAAENLLLEVLTICNRYQLRDILTYTAIQLIYFYLDNENVRAARQIYSIIEKYELETDINSADYILIINIRDRINLQEDELLNKYPKPLLNILERIKDRSTGSAKMETLSIYIHSCILQDDYPENFISLLGTMKDLHIDLRSTGGQDYETLMLTRGMYKVGLTKMADKLLCEYIDTYRTDKVPIPKNMACYLAEARIRLKIIPE